MKGIALILALIIFSTSLKASAFVGGIAGAFFQGEMTSHACCKSSEKSELKECDESEENNDESDCCDGDSCNCTCCLHVVYFQQFSGHPNQFDVFSEVKFGYSFLYQADYLKAVFHPPSIV